MKYTTASLVPNHDLANEGRSRTKLVVAGFAVVAAVLLAFEHRVHVLPYLPWLLLLACPLMHFFHHGGHGHHHGDEPKPDSADKP